MAGIRGDKPNDIEWAPLVLWTDGKTEHPEGRTKDNCMVYEARPVPSDQDYEAIKRIYPWRGP